MIDEPGGPRLELHHAIRRGEIRLEFQPEFDLRTNQIVALEALARWDHPTLGTLQADHFIRLAEQSGDIVELGEWVLRAACAQHAEWHALAPHLALVIRVNVSPLQLSELDFADLVAAVLAEIGMQPGDLCLEVTENVDPPDSTRVVDVLRTIRATGVGVALDDFGAGRNGLLRLREMTFDVLKIDRAFVTSLARDSADSIIVGAIIELARALNVDVVAEGIESAAAVEELLRSGCYRGQGYLLGGPVTAEVMTKVLASTSS
ncbi:MAG: hypothetical protein QOG80_3340 [Pseudonocardiales bacterium]|nr:hypothetical protein [Pseudonocardiales bacterium]